MNSKAVIALAFFAIIITMAIVRSFPLSCRPSSFEGFISPLQLSCPSGTISFNDKRGNLMCCNGQVNGNKCEGNIFCSFSGNTEYPLCGATKKRKYLGPINPFVKQMMTIDYDNKFLKILDIMKNIKKSLVSLPSTSISPEDRSTYDNLVDEEVTWYSDNSNSDSLTYQEECMYIIERLTTIFTGKPLMTNPKIIQDHVKAQICSAV